jgi:hypothetical protein
MRDALSALSSTNGGVFTRAQAIAAGYTERQIRLLVDAGLWASMRHGILVDGEHWPSRTTSPGQCWTSRPLA